MRYAKYVVYLFALVGVVFLLVFLAMQFGLLNVRGSADSRDDYFFTEQVADSVGQSEKLETVCAIHVLGQFAPLTALNIESVLQKTGNIDLVSKMLIVAGNRFGSNGKYMNAQRTCQSVDSSIHNNRIPQTAYTWADSAEWAVMKAAFIRDQEIIRQAATDARINPRILLGGVIGEQFRFFTNSRESFKQYFEPLKILASLSKFSFGIAGLKPYTVEQIDKHLTDRNSPFYLGKEMESVITYPVGVDHEVERFNRITDTENPYYAYLYVGLYMRQVAAQWNNAGYSIDARPEILATLYNLGFPRSIPKNNPQPGGAEIIVNGETYTFGRLAYEFYYSGELATEFPY